MRLAARPRLWLLTLNQTCRIFDDQTAPDIIMKQVFASHGVGLFRFELRKSCPALRYCVQKNATDFAFVSRLLETAGVHDFYRHGDGAHEMVLVDAAAELDTPLGYETCAISDCASTEAEIQNERRLQREVRPTRVLLRDHNPGTRAATPPPGTSAR